ncbi:hypothetical protein CBM2609_A100031 [Cupriavidus taiwanensis]|nr:hypothetical protein CBM2604_A80031 [Cupriavidus taiwanensis]SOZ21707.1 hypothetical protein CBM2609_A100031 [Cupriavidus taiwanensis]
MFECVDGLTTIAPVNRGGEHATKPVSSRSSLTAAAAQDSPSSISPPGKPISISPKPCRYSRIK